MKTVSSNNDNIKCIYQNMLVRLLSPKSYPLINPTVNPADILPVRGIPKLVIANEEAVVAAWISLLQIIIIIEVCVVIFANFVIV
jgi:hypothetical protein